MDMLRHPTPVLDDDGNLVAAEDWLGNTFRVGDRVIYCITAGTGGQMAVGDVVGMELQKFEFPNRPMWTLVRVKVRTVRTSDAFDYGPRTRPTWVTASNITALPIRLSIV